MTRRRKTDIINEYANNKPNKNSVFLEVLIDIREAVERIAEELKEERIRK